VNIKLYRARIHQQQLAAAQAGMCSINVRGSK